MTRTSVQPMSTETGPNQASSDTLLDIRGLRTEFATARGQVAAVRDVNLTVRRRQKLAIVGESGSGKSAMAMSVVGLVQPPGKVTAGEILLDGRNLRGLSDAELC